MKSLMPLKRHLYIRFGSLAIIEAGIIVTCLWLLIPDIPAPPLIFCLVLSLTITLGLNRVMTVRFSDSVKEYSLLAEQISNGVRIKQWPAVHTKEFQQLRDNLKSVDIKFHNREHALLESEQRLKELVSNVPGVVYQFTAYNPDTVDSRSSVITVIREKCIEILGMDPEPERFFAEFVSCLPLEDQPGFLQSIQEAVEKQSVWHYEGRFIRPDGVNIWIEAHSVPHKMGDATVFYGLVTDITERKKMETTLRFSQFIFDKADIAIFVLGDNGEFLRTNEQVSRYLGYTQNELKHMDIFDVDTVLTRDKWPEFMANLRAHGVQTIETLNRRKDGKIIPIQVIDNLMTFEGEEFHVAFVQDISERKQMELALSEKQQRLDLALASADEGIWDWDLMRNEVYFDSRYYTMAGYQPYEFPCALEEWENRTHEDDSERVKSVVQKYLSGELDNFEVEFRFRRKDDAYMWIQGRGKVVDRDEAGNPKRFIGTHTDITHRKSMEDSLRLTQFIFDKAPIGIWRMRNDGMVMDVNEQGCTSLGRSRSDLCGSWVFDFDPQMNPDAWRNYLDQLYATESITLESEHRRSNGEIFPIQVISKLMRFEGQDYHVAFVQDITARKRDEKELYRLRNYLTNIIDSMPSALIGVDSDGRVTQWNKTVESSTGINTNDARGNNIAELLPWMSAVTDKITHSIRTREVIHEQAKTRPCDNRACFEDVTIYPLVTNGVEGAVIRIGDVSEKVKLQEMMIQSEKMLSVGGLAAGMAHEINNPLAGILQTANVLSNRLVDKLDNPASIKAAAAADITTEAIQTFMNDRGIPRMLDAIKDSGSRIAEIVDNMLSFARKGSLTISSHCLNELMDKSIKLAMADYDLKKEYDFKQIEIVREYDENLPEIPCEGAKIQQVLLNLLSNGAQAMAQKESSQSRFILRTYLEQQSNQVCLEVEDNGPGMEEATRKRVFEPFFTTKPVGVGTGLGLSISYFIITENHNGRMSVESSPGNGSLFKICLPINQEIST